ncbi:hypothetical protein BOC36_01915 [Burkholderia pseudomallei]|uniref:Arm DNA-binding domain-containing protein n=1 Tax=Burkholderia pseudomallei TaxID=28450 RepID=UPI000A1A2F8E|nr:Arm DNA-binding domain-containing protein [Burkholderia pseudomallei]ARK52063.1 hypothetical protein BOC36_01915 [Burkholderia pseudomallei]
MPTLTELELKSLRPDRAGKTLSDGDGLFGEIRVNAKGVMSVRFYYRYRREGKPHNLGCGTWPKVSLKEIRRQHDATRRLHRDGTDPTDDRRTKALEQRANQKAEIARHEAQLARPTVRDLFDRWAALELANRKDCGAETKRGLEKDVLSAIGDRYADDITRADVTWLS